MQNTYIKFLSVISIARIHTVSNAVLGRAERVKLLAEKRNQL